MGKHSRNQCRNPALRGLGQSAGKDAGRVARGLSDVGGRLGVAADR